MSERSRWFVSSGWLAAHLDDPEVVVIDGTWHLAATGRDGRREYEVGHIPGALYFDIDAIADTANPLPHMLPAASDFAAAVGALGIDEQQTIVVYDGLGLSSAPRVWWTFRIFGARDVVLLEGGLPEWQKEGHPVETAIRPRKLRTFHATFDATAVSSFIDVRDGLLAETVQVVDARPRARFLGEAPEPRSWVKTGRIPGSLNLPSTDLVVDGRLKAPALLREAFIGAGVDLAKPIITSCGSGVNAATLTLALDILGVGRNALYDGAWTEWGGRSDTPVATGPTG